MNVAITLNDVVRAFSHNFAGAYQKNISLHENLEFASYEHVEGDVWVEEAHISSGSNHIVCEKIDPFRLSKTYSFNSEEDYCDLLYSQFSFEFFGVCELTYPKAMSDLNLLYQEIAKQHKCTLLSQEINNSKPATLHFLSYNKCLANNIKFLENFSKAWQSFDVIVTANPYILKKKNLNNRKKISIKIETEQNKGIPADYSFASLKEVYNFYQ